VATPRWLATSLSGNRRHAMFGLGTQELLVIALTAEDDKAPDTKKPA
jgi:hypothetical protein